MSTNDELILDGRKYISSRRAGEITSYTNDYIGQLCRAGKVQGKLIGRIRFVDEASLLSYKQMLDVATQKESPNGIQKEIPKYEDGNQTDILPNLEPKPTAPLGTKFPNNSDLLTNAWGSISYAEEPTETTETESPLSVATKPHGMRVPSPSRFFPSGFSHALLSKIVSSIAVVSLVTGGYFFSGTPFARAMFADMRQSAEQTLAHLSETGSNLSASALALAENIRPSFSGTLSYQAPFSQTSQTRFPPFQTEAVKYSPNSSSIFLSDTKHS
ncbi:MAG: hypothetical protein HYT28_03030 [Parcubacteria group bacterium]|nr:hypothetical protein [Parcubacteria group bacterium]